MSPGLLGFLRGLAMVVLLAVLSFIGDVSHLSPWMSIGMASLVSSLALAIEHAIEAKTGNALFGAATVRR